MQKEQSAVLSRKLKDRQRDWIMGYGATDSKDIPKYAGPHTQVEAACRQMRNYVTPGHKHYVGPWIRHQLTIDNKRVTSVNAATAACYKYTPHLHGNKSLWEIYYDWFGDAEETMALAAIRAARAQVGKRYIWGAEVRLDDPNPRAFDCSELVQWAFHQVGLTVSDGSHNQWVTSTKLPVQKALRIPAALVFRWSQSRKRVVHVGIVAPRGNHVNIIEAKGRLYGVVEGEVKTSAWTHAGYFPGLYLDATTGS